VVQRRREFGVRRALGASGGQIVGMVAREATLLTFMGLAIGTLVSLGAGFVIRRLLYGVEAYDPATLVGTSVVVGAAALLASIGPARRAAHVELRAALEEA
jgi:putative ABC transport system permease protein